MSNRLKCFCSFAFSSAAASVLGISIGLGLAAAVAMTTPQDVRTAGSRGIVLARRRPGQGFWCGLTGWCCLAGGS